MYKIDVSPNAKTLNIETINLSVLNMIATTKSLVLSLGKSARQITNVWTRGNVITTAEIAM